MYDGAFTQRVREQFHPLVDKAARQFLNDQVKDRLDSALDGPDYTGDAGGSVDDVEAIYQHADQLRKTVSRYLNGSAVVDAEVIEILQS